MKDLSLADLLTLREYVQNHNSGRTLHEWNKMMTTIEAEISSRMRELYFTLEC